MVTSAARAVREILIVDDDQRIRQPLGLILGAAGYAVTEAADGREAISKLRGGLCRPTTIVLDLEMPRLDGRGFLFELRAMAPSVVTASPVILMSGTPEVGKVAAEFRLPTYFTKPLVVERLLDAIENLHHRQIR